MDSYLIEEWQEDGFYVIMSFECLVDAENGVSEHDGIKNELRIIGAGEYEL